MSEFIVYSEKKAFDEITFYGEYPNLKGVLANHSRIFLNLNKEEIQRDIDEQGEIFNFLHANAGSEIPESYSAHFKNIKDDESVLLSTPRSIYFLDITEQEADSLQTNYGVIVQSSNNLNDNVLKGTFFKTLAINSICNDGAKKGWETLFKVDIPPLNTVVISDNYLFANEDGKRGTANLLQLLKSILPNHLTTDFHILIVAQEHKDKDAVWCERKKNEIQTDLNGFNKPYNFTLELVFTETIHKRILISNYFILVVEQGFAVFKTNDLMTVHEDTTIEINKIFSRTEKSQGDTVFDDSSFWLEKIKNKCISTAQYILNRPNDKNYRILGDCNPDKSLKNRLINDV